MKQAYTTILLLTSIALFGQNDIKFSWIVPDEFEGYDIEADVDHLYFKIRVISNNADLTEDDFAIYINNELATKGEQYEEAKQAIYFQQSFRGDNTIYQIVGQFNLKEGENNIFLRVKKPNGVHDSPMMTINYNSPKPNLHLYAIDIPYNYGDSTATLEFVERYKNLSTPIYDNIHIKTFVTPETTRADSIINLLENIYNQYLSMDKIRDGDVLVFYLRAHTYVREVRPDDLYLAAADYDLMQPRATSINLKRDVIEVLEEIPSIKSIIIIERPSAGILPNADPSNAKYKISLPKSDGITIINQQNNCLTTDNRPTSIHQLLEQSQLSKMDTDQDGVVYLQEFQRHLQQIDCLQITVNQIQHDFPLFVTQ